MYLGSIETERALGAILVHTLRVGKTVLKKGKILQADDLLTLQNHQISRVTVARPQEGDILEDQAAGLVARIFAHQTIWLSNAATGRVNLFSRVKGLLILNPAFIDKG